MISLLQRKSLRLFHPFLRRLVRYYLKKPRKYRFENLNLIIYPSVFHPGLFYSTQYLISFISQLDLTGKRLLELGAGSGLISMVCAKKEAMVTATDINVTALEGIRKNAARNNLNIEAKESDLFDQISPVNFDFIIINPPYYPKTPQSAGESAWFCGENFEYFEKLFRQLSSHETNGAEIFMVLSEDCDLDKIHSIADTRGYRLDSVSQKTIGGEENFIFSVKKNQAHNQTSL